MFGAYHGTIKTLLQNFRCTCSIWHLSKPVFRDNNSGLHISEPYNKIGFSNVSKSFNCSLYGKLSLFDNKHVMYPKTFCPFLLRVSLASQNFPEGVKTSPRYVWDSVTGFIKFLLDNKNVYLLPFARFY